MIKKLIIIIPVLLITSFVAGMQYFAHSVRMTAAAYSPNVNNDVSNTGIVVATGHDGRIPEGVMLLAEEHATRLLISGVGNGVQKSDIKRIVATALVIDDASLDALLECCIDLGDVAADTQGNAVEARDWAKANGLKKIIIVTSDFHMPRAMIAFERYFSKENLIAHHVKTPWLQLDENGFSGWWQTPQRISLITIELVKYLARVILR